MAYCLKQMQDSLGLLRLGYADALLRVPARQWREGSFEARTEQVVEETPVVIVYNNIPHVVMMATPRDLEDFAVGFSVTEELIRSPADLEAIEVVKYSQGIELRTYGSRGACGGAGGIDLGGLCAARPDDGLHAPAARHCLIGPRGSVLHVPPPKAALDAEIPARHIVVER